MDHHSLARLLLALFCAAQGASTALIDLGRTHATHPGWLGHARFHVVWQTATTVALSLMEIALVLLRGPWEEHRFYLAAAFACAPMLGFFAALAARRLYHGTLTDPHGMRPWIVRLPGAQLAIDLNLVAEIAGVASLVAIVSIYHWH